MCALALPPREMPREHNAIAKPRDFGWARAGQYVPVTDANSMAALAFVGIDIYAHRYGAWPTSMRAYGLTHDG